MDAPAGKRHDDDLIPRRPPPRPLVVPAVALMLGIAAAERLGPSATALRAIAIGGLVAAGTGLLVIRRRSAARIALTLVLAGAFLSLGFARYQLALSRPPEHVAHVLADEPFLTRVAGRIVSPPIERPAERRNPFLPTDVPPRTTFVLALEALHTVDPPQPLYGRLRVTVEAHHLGLHAGDRVQLTGRIHSSSPPRNPGEPDWTRWYRHQNLDGGLSVDGAAHVRHLPQSPRLRDQALRPLRTAIQSLLLEPFADAPTDPSARLLDVMVLGQRSSADRALNDAFLRAGGMHFLAVSGFHVGVLAAFAWLLARHVLRLGRRGGAVAMLVATVLYAAIAEPNAPILRAATMVVVGSIGLLLLRPINVINWLAASAIVVLLFNPHELFRAGFQLSFVQVLALVLLVPPLHVLIFHRWRDDLADLPREADTLGRLLVTRLGHGIAGLALVCAVAYVVALPLVLLHFQRLAPWGWLGTLLLSPLVVITIVVSFATLLAGLVLPPLGQLLGIVLRAVTHALMAVVGVFEHFPAAVIELGHPPPGWLVVASYALLLWIALRMTAAGRAPGSAMQRWPLRAGGLMPAGASVLLALAWLGWSVLPGGEASGGHAVHVLAVGNGLTTLVTTPARTATIFDAGTMTNTDAGELAVRALRALGRPRLAHVLISHANFDHYSGLPTLLGSRPEARWCASPYFVPPPGGEDPLRRLRNLLPQDRWPPDVLHAGNTLDLDGGTLQVLWPPDNLPGDWSANDRSLVARLEVAGRRVLLTGDIEEHGLAALVAREQAGEIDLAADVLIAPHHGATRPITGDFLAAISPRVIIVSSAERRPRLERLAAELLGPSVRILTTGEVGAVSVAIDEDGKLAVSTARRSANR